MKRILSIDDDEAIHKLLKAFLKNNYELTTAINGEEALEYLRRTSELPHLILLDVNMPEMNGLAFKAFLDEDPRLKKIPLIYLTANDKNSERVKHSNRYDFLNKPIEKEDLIFTIETQLRMNDREQS